jgi:hypothetical protein
MRQAGRSKLPSRDTSSFDPEDVITASLSSSLQLFERSATGQVILDPLLRAQKAA